jgi:hypothetical protein
VKDLTTIHCVVHNRCHTKEEISGLNFLHKTWYTQNGKVSGWGCVEWFKGKLPEFVPQHIKEGRRDHHDSLLQPYRDGEFSKEYKDAYPEISQKMVNSGVISKQQYDSAKDVWKGDEL